MSNELTCLDSSIAKTIRKIFFNSSDFMLKHEKKIQYWQSLLKGRMPKLAKELTKAPSIEIAEFLEEQPIHTCIEALNQLDIKLEGEVFGLLAEKRQLEIYSILGPQLIAPIFVEMASDLRVDFYKRLDDKAHAELLPFIPKEVRKDIITLSAYSSEVAGGIMNTDFVTLQNQMNATQALAQIRKDVPSQKMIYHLYVVDENMKLLGVVSLKKIILSDPEAKVGDMIRKDFIFVTVDQDKESVANTIEKYGFVAVPVLNRRGQLVGIVSQEDALEVIRAEQTEDMERFMGILSNEKQEDYLETPIWDHFKKRIGWIAGLFIASFLSFYAQQRYGSIFSLFPMLSFFTTTLNDTGGNVGSQVAMVVIRALALEQINVKNWLIILWKEIRISLMVVSILAGLMLARILLLTDTTRYAIPSQGLLHTGLVLALVLSLQVITSTVIGSMLPLIIKRLNRDPALAASPAITTLVDLTGMLIYFNIATLFLG